MLEVAGGNRNEVGDTQRHLLGLWTSGAEKLGCWVMRGEGRSWAMTEPESANLQTGWEVGLCEKPCTFFFFFLIIT